MSLSKREFIEQFVLNRAASKVCTDGPYWVEEAARAWDEMGLFCPVTTVESSYPLCQQKGFYMNLSARLKYLRKWWSKHGSSTFEDADDWLNSLSNVELIEVLSWADE